LLVSVVFVVSFSLLAILIYQASPGPDSQVITGVGIGSYDNESGIVYLSGRRLNCVRIDGAQAFAASCEVDILGKTLEIHARRNLATDSHQLSGTCAAFYDGEEWPCSIGSRHVHVHWFAFLSEPLGLDRTQLEALRRQYLIENLPQGIFPGGAVLISATTALIAILGASAWLWPRRRNRFSFLAVVTAVGSASLVSSFLLFFLLTQGFWD
jgi:hypothetical protein